MIQQMLAISSLIPLPFLNPAWTSESSRFMYCWSLAWKILSFTLELCIQIGILFLFSFAFSFSFAFLSELSALPFHSSHTLAKQCSKFSKWDFNSTWTKKFQMFKLDLEKTKVTGIKCQHLLDHRESRRVPEKHLLLLYWLCQSLWLCGWQLNVENS